jgi:hypothetical protein
MNDFQGLQRRGERKREGCFDRINRMDRMQREFALIL